MNRITKRWYHLQILYSDFWKRCPALKFGIYFLMGIGGALSLPILFLIPIYLLFEKGSFLKKIQWIGLSAVGFFYFFSLALCDEKSPSKQDNFHFQIEEIKPHVGPFATSLVYIGKIDRKKTCHIYVKEKNRPLAHCSYWIEGGTLIRTAPYQYLLKTTKHTRWVPIKNSHSPAEKRYRIKEKVKAFVKPYYKEKRVYDLMAALLSGTMENRVLAFQFNQLGLQHLLAISGFHFSLLAFFLGLLFRSFLSVKWTAFTLLICLALYFFYMGDSPSISRAWISALLILIGIFFHYKSTPLNALGVAVIAAIIADPLVILRVGFQLSYIATLGILLLYAPMERGLQKVFELKSFESLLLMSHYDQYKYIFTSFIRKIISLNLAVFVLTLPFLLFHFQKFPLLSLIYNLFFPLFFCGLIALLLVGCILSLIFPIVGQWIHLINEKYSFFLLELIAHAPKKYSFCLRTPPFSFHLLVWIFVTILGIGIYFHQKKRNNFTNI